jgi:uncharacterized protein YjdB
VDWLRGALWLLALCALAACGGAAGSSDGGDAAVGDVNPAGITVSPAEAQVAIGASLPLSVRVLLRDGTARAAVPGDGVTWQSSDARVATVDALGVVRGVAMGACAVTARLGTSGAATSAISVPGPHELDQLQITPSSSSVGDGQRQQFTAIGHFRDGMTADVTTTATWTSSEQSVATIDANGDALAGTMPGTTYIQARVGTIVSNTAALTNTSERLVLIVLTPASATLHAGDATPVQLTATGTLDTGATLNVTGTATWSSSNPRVAAVSNTAGTRGQVTASATMTGTAQITAAFQGTTSDVATIAVLPSTTITALNITPSTGSVPAGMDQQFTATATYADMRTADVTARATWSSSAAATATINPTTGLAHGVAPGEAVISASIPDGAGPSSRVTATASLIVDGFFMTSIAVSPAAASMPLGTTQRFTATGTFSDASSRPLTTGVAWSTSNAAIATIDATGLATAVSPGTVTIRAGVGTLTASATLVVLTPDPRSLVITPASATLAAGDTVPLHAVMGWTDGSMTDVSSLCAWSSSDLTRASVDATGHVTAVAPGASVTIRAATGSFTATATITVSP